MATFSSSLVIDRTPRQVYAVLDDVAAAPRWMPAIKKIEVTTPDQSMGVGFRWKETRKIFGPFRMTLELGVTQHQPPTLWQLTFDDGKTWAQATFRLKPHGAGTHIDYILENHDLRGNKKREERMGRMMEKSDRELLQRLKAYVESLPAPSPPPPAPRRTFAPVAVTTAAAKQRTKVAAPRKKPAAKAKKAAAKSAKKTAKKSR